MTTSRFESRKPKYQNQQLQAQPPMGATAVFEWEQFASLGGNYSDDNMLEVYQRISRDIIERPYHYHDDDIADANGKLIPTEFTLANNLTPPATIKNGVLYKRNHGTCHALRQMVYTDKIIDAIAEKGNATGQDLAQKITANDEIKSAIKLAAYCKRIGRTFDYESDENTTKHGLRPAHKPTVYSKRSARMFAMIAEELGYSADLINIIEDSMLEADAVNPDPAKIKQFATIDGINGKTLRDLSHNVLIAAHRADLTRIFEVKRHTIENDLAAYFDKSRLNEVSNGIIVMGCEGNAMTGNKVIKQQDSIIYNHTIDKDGKKIFTIDGTSFTEQEIAAKKEKTALIALDGKKAVDTAQDLGKTMADLTKLQLIVKPQLINPYAYKTSIVAAGRFHFFTASLADTLPAAIKAKYKGCSGDYLKTEILKDLKREIEGFTDIQFLNDFKQNLEQRPEYKILKTAQGLFSTITGKKTSSIEALENMIEQKEDHFKHAPAHAPGL